MKKLIVFLIRKKLGVHEKEAFRFSNQKKDAVYYFTGEMLLKAEDGTILPAGVSLNWLLDDRCTVEPVLDQSRFTA